MEEKESKKDQKQIKEEYSKLSAKYSLPDYETLDRDFEISDIDSEENILREVLKQMHDHVDFYSRLLEGLIQPDSKLCDMKEAGNLSTPEDQTIIMETYRKCMYINRILLLSNLDYNEEETAKHIIHISTDWQYIKKDLKHILTKMKNTWKHEEEKKETQGGYFG